MCCWSDFVYQPVVGYLSFEPCHGWEEPCRWQQHRGKHNAESKGSVLPSTFISSTFISYHVIYHVKRLNIHPRYQHDNGKNKNLKIYFLLKMVIYHFLSCLFWGVYLNRYINFTSFQLVSLWCLYFFPPPLQVDVSRGSKEGSRREASRSGTRTCGVDPKTSLQGKGTVPSSKIHP